MVSVPASPHVHRARKADSRLERLHWLAMARAVLIESGIDRVKVLPLAQRLGVTTGSFYWHFADRAALLAALLADWEETNSRAFSAALAVSADPHAQFDHLVDTWIREDDFSPSYDSAIRDWARTDPQVEATVRRIDDQRIARIWAIFTAMGDPEPDALVRARIVYYHQVGYYALRISLPQAERELLKPVYIRLLKGHHHR